MGLYLCVMFILDMTLNLYRRWAILFCKQRTQVPTVEESFTLYTPWGILYSMQNLRNLYSLFSPRLVLGVVVILVGLVGYAYFKSETIVEVPKEVTAEVALPPKSVSTIAYPVAGVIEASESVTLYAKRSGFIEEIAIKEGDVVEAGASLVLAVDPVTRSRLSVQDEIGLLNKLKATNSLLGAEETLALAGVGYEQSVALAGITNSASGERTEAAYKQLAMTLTQVEAVVPQALRFVQDNKSLFTSDSMDLYTKVVEAFYKQEPNYLRIGLTSTGEAEALLAQVAQAKTASSSEMVAVAELVASELGTLIDLYARSESEFFDKEQLSSSATELAAYSEYRTNLAELASGLVLAIDGASALGSAEKVNIINSTSSAAKAEVGKMSAAAQLDITKQIESATGRLSAAELAVLVTELGLGLSEAPFASVVTEVFVERGQYVEAGEPLLRLSGAGAQELKIKISGAALSVQVGDAFLIDGKTVGSVDRVVPVLEAGSATAYISITEPQRVGEVVRGELAVSVGAGLQVISRNYLVFDSTGPYVTTKAGEKIYVKIIHDQGAWLVVEGERELNEELAPAFGIRL